ncbi:MAG: ABC transporter permease [Clostridiales bacterium]|nr:ABC transporter permease [Clostridiales bacterium]
MLEALKFVLNEHIENRKLIFKLAIVNMNKQTMRTSLGVLWLYLHDFVYFSVFVMFRILMSGGGEIDGMHSVVFLVTGTIPWFFMQEALNVGAGSIKSYKSILKSIKFPITIIPTVEVTGIFLKRIFTFLFIFGVCGYFGYLHCFNPLLFVYYVFCMLILMYAVLMTVSAFAAVSSDFHQLYTVVLRVLMFTLPIMWGYKHISGHKIIEAVVRIDPMVYILNGFRNAFVVGGAPSLVYSIYFWLCVIVFFTFGSFIQFKLRKYYADLM